ncbi:hypothetical protein ACQ86N_32815 [Puia sp. P3]|uniref:hypothetical protein n=1 Tax=Puia sp. P3 TaxID=3423952 RepID=UPI003D66CE9E
MSYVVVLPLLAAYLLLAALGLHYHELWLDESQHFLIGRDSDSLGALYYNMRYDGHPRLWNFMIFFVTHFITRSYVGMQVMHLVIAGLSAFLCFVLRRSACGSRYLSCRVIIFYSNSLC